MKTFCTIITRDYFPKALILFKSIREFNPDMTMHVFIADNGTAMKNVPAGLMITTVDDLSTYPLVSNLYKKYAHINIDQFRWALKPVFAGYLLETGHEKVIYLDCDMFFVNDYNFLWDELERYDFMLTPHWNNTNPLENKQSFLSNFTSGIFSAGFFGAGKNGLPALTWWAQACHFMMGPQLELGVHDDQRYLDILPVLFENTKIIRHRGCNIGAWNYSESVRSQVNGQVLINDKYPVIFIHFDEMMIATILRGHDQYLLPYLNKYQQSFTDEGYDLSRFISNLGHHADASLLLRMKWNIRLRTRIKKFLYYLAERL